MKIAGVYAILGPNGVYVGESRHCWGRNTLGLAVALGLDCGIIRELPNSTRLDRVRAEAEVAKLFIVRGLPVISKFLGYAWPEQYKAFRQKVVHEPRPRKTHVSIDEHGHHVIRTDTRHATAILQVLSGASLAEVGRGMGISRERVRQYLNDAGLTTKVRVRQRAQSDATRDSFFSAGGARRRKIVKAQRKQRLLGVLLCLTTFAQQKQRAPSYDELHELYFGKRAPSKGYAGARMMGLVGCGNGPANQRRAIKYLHRLYRLAGLQVRSRGGPGHIKAVA